MKKSNNTIYIFTAVLGVVALALVGATFVFGDSTFAQSDPLTVETSPIAPSSNEGAQILALLTEMQNIKLDTEIFTNPLFLNLNDFTVDLSPEPKNRPNPFALIGKDSTIKFDTGNSVTSSPFTSSSTPSVTRP